MDVLVQSCRGDLYDKKAGQLSPRTECERASAKLSIPRFQEKLRRESIGCPYRKPTQVGEEKILRRLRELSSKELGKLTP